MDRFNPWLNQYLSRRLPTSGISRHVYYNGQRVKKGRAPPKLVYVYAGAMVDDYQKAMTTFNLNQVSSQAGLRPSSSPSLSGRDATATDRQTDRPMIRCMGARWMADGWWCWCWWWIR